MKKLSEIIGRSVSKIISFHATGRELPAWLQKQQDGIYQIETDPARGIAILKEGLQDEADHLEGLLNG